MQIPSHCIVHRFDAVDSTNTKAHEFSVNSDEWHVFIAASQSQGRGRKDRLWESPIGNVYMTLRIPLAFFSSRLHSLDYLPLLSYVTTLSISQTVINYVSNKTLLQHKWPNDVLYDGKKLSGAMLEVRTSDNAHEAYILIGIGVNITECPKNTLFSATDLRACSQANQQINLEAIYISLVDHINHFIHLWCLNGFSPIREAWLERGYCLGKPIQLRHHKDQLSGIFSGINDQGELLLLDSNHQMHLVRMGETL